jgi:hypothetical protein
MVIEYAVFNNFFLWEMKFLITVYNMLAIFEFIKIYPEAILKRGLMKKKMARLIV